MPCCGLFPFQSRVDSFHSVAQCRRFCFGLSVVGGLLKCLVSWWGCLALPLRAQLAGQEAGSNSQVARGTVILCPKLAMASAAAFTGGACQPATPGTAAIASEPAVALETPCTAACAWQAHARSMTGAWQEPRAAPAEPATPRNLVPQPWTEQSPDQGRKRNAEGHVERSASKKRRIAERMAELADRSGENSSGASQTVVASGSAAQPTQSKNASVDEECVARQQRNAAGHIQRLADVYESCVFDGNR